MIIALQANKNAVIRGCNGLVTPPLLAESSSKRTQIDLQIRSVSNTHWSSVTCGGFVAAQLHFDNVSVRKACLVCDCWNMQVCETTVAPLSEPAWEMMPHII